ncbi:MULTISPECIES: response regulator [unclassified Coleofasciculus]|uniref:response regulator n=1 Tax=unclassified Coleofasciculus TaxID=2692782 RepID=UPI00188051F6|nr:MULTISPECIES: response regulator [unclassified Coleofasciculus]MBE9127031.1 response regulator [Coleofasciculus sp. LEGE 07081]MBE9147290.1 response regulator [Coleofasciculus sp. LEGE 07092]
MESESKANILLVDDRPENLLALEAMLESLGQNLVKAHSGEEALRCLLHQDFAVILLDVQMPGMDGFETATLIRNRKRSHHTPIIFLTAFSKSESLMFKGYSLGAVDYLFKPINSDILTSKVTVFVDLFKKTEEVKHQAEQLTAVNAELGESEERFRSLSACSPVGIFLTDVAGNCNYINPRCQTICGFTPQEILGGRWTRLVHPENPGQVLADWSAKALNSHEYFQEFCFLTVEERARWVRVRLSPMFSDNGELLGHVGTIEDITERKQAEEARAQIIREQAARQQAEAANRMKDEFLATLSHELRTPLNSVLGWAGLLRTRKFDEATTARALETIERNAKSQAQLIEDILDVSRIIQGKLSLNLCPISLVPVIEVAMDAVQPAAEAKAIQLESVVDPELELVLGDSERLQQVVWNLLTNAIKFTPESGRVEVRLECVDSYAQIRVIDTGIGIGSDFLPYVFERFRQKDSTTTRTHGGLGLGLAIVRHLVELQGGSVCADSSGEGRGATFTVKLPLQKSAELEDNCIKSLEFESEINATSAELSTLLSGLQVFIVDDEPDVREFLTTALVESGAKAIALSSAGEAFKFLEQLKPDVLVSDIGMPIEDGYTLIRKVRDLEAKRGGFLPAVALTAYAQKEDCKSAIESGFQMHLSKPIDSTKLVIAVARLAGRTLERVKP